MVLYATSSYYCCLNQEAVLSPKVNVGVMEETTQEETHYLTLTTLRTHHLSHREP